MNKINKLTKEQKAYIAGFLDADGSIGVYRTYSKSNMYPYNFGIRLIIVNSNVEIIEWLKEVLGIGCVHYVRKEGQYNKKWKAVHRYQAVGDICRQILNEILPYLRVKKDRAVEVLKMPNDGRLEKCRALEKYQLQENLFYKLKKMNLRGVDDEVSI